MEAEVTSDGIERWMGDELTAVVRRQGPYNHKLLQRPLLLKVDIRRLGRALMELTQILQSASINSVGPKGEYPAKIACPVPNAKFKPPPAIDINHYSAFSIGNGRSK